MGPSDAPIADPPALIAPSIEETRWGELSLHALGGARGLSVSALDAPLRASGLEQIVPLCKCDGGVTPAVFVSLHGGYIRQLGEVGWMTSDGGSHPLGGMPHLDLSGGWVALGVGFGGYGKPRPGSPLGRVFNVL